MTRRAGAGGDLHRWEARRGWPLTSRNLPGNELLDWRRTGRAAQIVRPRKICGIAALPLTNAIGNLPSRGSRLRANGTGWTDPACEKYRVPAFLQALRDAADASARASAVDQHSEIPAAQMSATTDCAPASSREGLRVGKLSVTGRPVWGGYLPTRSEVIKSGRRRPATRGAAYWPNMDPQPAGATNRAATFQPE